MNNVATKKKNIRSFLFSLIFHVIVLTILVVSFEWGKPIPVVKNSDQDMKIMNAVVMDAPAGDKIPKFIPEEKNPEKPAVIEVKKAQPIKKIQSPPKELAESQVKPQPENKPKPEVKKIAISDLKKKQQDLLEKQFLADLKELKKPIKKKLSPKMSHQDIETEFAKELKAREAQVLAQQLLQEKNSITRLQSQKMRGVIDKYKSLILQAISRNWLVPPTVNKKLSCELLIKVAPGGMVLDVQIAKTSGDLGLDRSARAAVFKASPLPVPSVAEGFDAFRQFILKVKPDNIEKVTG